MLPFYCHIQDIGAHEDCVHTMAGGLWNDYYCGARYNYICGPGKYNLKLKISIEIIIFSCLETKIIVSIFCYQLLRNGVNSSVTTNVMTNT